MTQEEFNALPPGVKKSIERLERLVRKLMIDIGPLRAAEMLRTIANNLASVRIK